MKRRLTTLKADAMAHFGIDPVMYENYPESFIKKLVKSYQKEQLADKLNFAYTH